MADLDPVLASVYNNLAATLEKLGAPRDAEALYVHAIYICEARLPPAHPRAAHIRKKLAALQVPSPQLYVPTAT